MPASWLNPEWRPPADKRATIVCVHGAVVDGYEMFLMRKRLAQLGYRTRLFQYRSMLRGLEDNAQRLREFIARTDGDILHVVGHSMGGVLTRLAFEQSPDPRPGRLIAIGSPLRDCWVGRRINRFHHYLGRYLIGRTVLDHISRPHDPVWHGTRDFGVLSGTYPFGIGAIFQSHPRPSDGVVLLHETCLEGIRDQVSFRLNHFGMLLSKRCAMQVARFLATGTFAHPDPDSHQLPVKTVHAAAA